MFLRPDDVAELRKIFAGLQRPVTLHVVSDDLELRLLVEEVAATAPTDRLVVEKLPTDADPARLAELGVTRTPAIALTADSARGKLLFYGAPVGYEMATLVAAIVDLGTAADGELVTPATRDTLAALSEDVHIQVFSTPG